MLNKYLINCVEVVVKGNKKGEIELNSLWKKMGLPWDKHPLYYPRGGHYAESLQLATYAVSPRAKFENFAGKNSYVFDSLEFAAKYLEWASGGYAFAISRVETPPKRRERKNARKTRKSR